MSIQYLYRAGIFVGLCGVVLSMPERQQWWPNWFWRALVFWCGWPILREQLIDVLDDDSSSAGFHPISSFQLHITVPFLSAGGDSFWWSGLILESSLEIALRSISNKPGACFAVNSFMAAGSYSGPSLLVWWYSASWNFPTSSSRELPVNECRFQHIVIRLYNWQLCYII